MKKCILIITNSIDSTVDSIIQRFNKKVDFFRINLDNFSNYKISVGQDYCIWEITDVQRNISINKSEICSIYYGAVQKETGSPNYFKFTREFKSAKI